MIQGDKKSRILFGISANLFAQVVTLGIQLAGVPILLSIWGTFYYGEWLILFSIPSYLGMSDMGLGTVATTDISLSIARHDYAYANRIFRGAFFCISIFGFLTCSLFCMSLWIFPFYKWLNLEVINYDVIPITLSILSGYVFFAIILSLPLGIYRSLGLYGRGQMISTIFRIIEFISFICIVLYGGNTIHVSIGFLLVRIIYFLTIWFDIQNKSKWFSIKYFSFEWNAIRPLIVPSLSMMTNYLGQSLISQGIVTIIGINLGSAKVVLFSTVRTLCNFAKQMIGVVNLSLFSEFTISSGENDITGLRRLCIRSIQFNIGLTFLSVLLLKLFGPWVLSLWTKGNVSIEEPFFSLYLVYILINSFWISNWNMLLARNEHFGITFQYILLNILSLFLISYFSNSYGISLIPTILILSDLLFSYFVIKKSLNVLDLKYNDYLFKIFNLSNL